MGAGACLGVLPTGSRRAGLITERDRMRASTYRSLQLVAELTELLDFPCALYHTLHGAWRGSAVLAHHEERGEC